MKLSKKDFQDAVKIAMMATTQDSTVYASGDCLLFDNNTIYSYNGYTSIAKKFITEEPLQGAVRAKELFSIINKIQDKEFEIKDIGKSWNIRAGRANYELVKKADLELNSIERIIPKDNEWIYIPDNLFEALNFCILNDNNTNIFIGDDVVYSTDGFRIYQYKLSTLMTNKVLINTQLVKSVVCFNNIKGYAITKGWIHFRDDDGSIISVRKYDTSQYPKDEIERVIKENTDGDYVKCAIPDMLIQVIDRASILSKEVDKYDAITMKLTNTGITVKSNNEYGKFEESTDAEIPYNAEFVVSVIMLKDCLKDTDSFYIRKIAVKGTAKETVNLVFSSSNGIKILSTMD